MEKMNQGDTQAPRQRNGHPGASNAKHYFVVMKSYGARGLEAIVDPETTRRGMIARIVSGEDRADSIAWIHEVRDYGDNQPIITDDITEEVLSEARTLIERKDDFKLEMV